MASYETEMGTFDAIAVRGTPRYRLNKKMISVDKVPAGIKAQLDFEIAQNEEARKARNEAALAEAHENEQQPREEAEFNEVSPAQNVSSEPFAPIADEPTLNTSDNAPEFTEAELLEIAAEEARRNGSATSPMLSAKELADQLYKNYGVWTVYTGVAPSLGDTHPITGVPMIRYDVGLGYQAVRNGEAKQIFNPEPVSHAPIPGSAFVGAPVEDTGYKSFDQRTAPSFVKQSSTQMKTYNNDPISEEPTAEPTLRGQTVRPEW